MIHDLDQLVPRARSRVHYFDYDYGVYYGDTDSHGGDHTGLLLACEVQSFRITGRAQFPIGTVPGYMYMKYGYTEFVFGGWTDSENQLSD